MKQRIKDFLTNLKIKLVYANNEFQDAINPIFPKDSATRSIVKFAISYILVATILTERLAHVLAFSWLLYCIKTQR